MMYHRTTREPPEFLVFFAAALRHCIAPWPGMLVAPPAGRVAPGSVIFSAAVLAFLDARSLHALGLCRPLRRAGRIVPAEETSLEAKSRATLALVVAGIRPAPGPLSFADAIRLPILSPLDVPAGRGAGAQSWPEAYDEIDSWQLLRDAASGGDEAAALPPASRILACVQRLAALEDATRHTFPYGSL